MKVEVSDIGDELIVFNPDFNTNRSCQCEITGQIPFDMENLNQWLG